MRFAIVLLVASFAAPAMEWIERPGSSPLVTFRIVFRTGSARDPEGKPGAVALTAAMLSDAGTREKTYKQILDEMFPMATRVSAQVDKEMISFAATTHVDNLEGFYKLFSSMLLDPGWRDDDLKRNRDDAINFLRVTLRGNNDEELGKEVLYSDVFAGHPYGRHNLGTVASLNALTMADLRQVYQSEFTQANLMAAIAGGYPAGFPARMHKDFARLPAGEVKPLRLPPPKPIQETAVTIVDKQTRSVAYSFGFPLEVRRGHPDYPALLVAQSALGQHRSSGGRLFQAIRETRGLNYGDYAYIEHFPNGMFQFEPDPNLARQQQIFQIWIRPLEPPTALFGLRLALHELEKLVASGLTEEEFLNSRNFLAKYVNLLTKTKSGELGYAIDSQFYGIPEYGAYLRAGLAKLTRDDVNRAIRKHLRTDRLRIAVITSGGEEFRQKLLADEPSPMKYNSPKPDDLLAEDKKVESHKLGLKPVNVRVVQVATVFE